jgi:hypothetical protein
MAATRSGRKRSLNEIAAALEAQGYVTRRGTRYGGGAVARLAQKMVAEMTGKPLYRGQ